MPRLLVATLALVLALSACTSGGETTGVDQTVLPIDDIVVGEETFVRDVSGNVRLELETNIDVACQIVFGETPEYGILAVDDDMQGGAHTDHSPNLGQLEPGRTYHYVLQGSDAAGNLYRSEPRTFVAPMVDLAADPRAAAAGRTNVAPTATVSGVSSEFSTAFAAANAIDGDLGTEWSSAGDGDNAFIELDLPQPTPITGVGFWTRAMGDGTAIIESIRILVDGTDLGTFPVGRDLTVVDLDVTGQRVRVEAATSTGGNTGAVEVEVYVD